MQSTGEFEGIVLAGVHCWRDGAFEASEARPLVPLAGQPLLCHALAWLRGHGATRATICANSESPAVRRALGDGSGVGLELDYYEDWLPRGTAGCIHDAALGARAQRLVVVDGTLVPQLDLRLMLDQHIARGAALTLAVEAAENGELQPVGAHIVEASAASLVPAVGYQDLKEGTIERLHRANGLVDAFHTDTASMRVSDAWSYLEAHGRLLEQMNAAVLPDPSYRASGSGWIHETSRVGPGARLIGPVLVGPHSHVETEAVLVGPLSIGEDCRIERGALVSRSVLWNGCRVGQSARVDRSILVHSAEVGCGEQFTLSVVAPRARHAWSRSPRVIGRGHGSQNAAGSRSEAITLRAQPAS